MPVPVVVLADLDDRAREALGNRAEGLRDDATAAVLPVLERIRRDGDAAVLEFLRDVDGVELTADQLIVDEGTIAAAAASVPADLVGAMAHTVRNLERYHRAQLIEEFAIEVEPGVTVGERFPAVRAAGCYVPFGTAIYPSSALMLTTPARVAGVERIVLASGVDPRPARSRPPCSRPPHWAARPRSGACRARPPSPPGPTAPRRCGRSTSSPAPAAPTSRPPRTSCATASASTSRPARARSSCWRSTTSTPIWRPPT